MHHYYQSNLSARAASQFAAAFTGAPTAFYDTFIEPYLIYPRLNTCIVLSPGKKVERTHLGAQFVLDGTFPYQTFSFFTNPLRMVELNSPEQSDVNGRVAVNPFVTLTIEFDDGGIPFVEEQLAWLRGQRRQEPMTLFYNSLRASYHDLRGLTICYSGNKSFHYHFTFDTQHLTSTPFPLDGFKRAWERLEGEFRNFFGVTAMSDQSLKNAGSYRRLPNAIRELEKDNLFGVPASTEIVQATMFEIISSRAGYGAATPFLRDPDFASPLAPLVKAGSNAVHLTQVTTAEAAYLEGRLKTYFPDGEYPEFVGFENDRNGVIARFRNHAYDRNPASLMKAGFSTVGIMGANPHGLTPGQKKLPAPLGEMLKRWSDDWHLLNTPPDPRKNLPSPPFNRDRTDDEIDFALAATDYESASKAVADILVPICTNYKPDVGGGIVHQSVLLSAPEGISKTRSLFTSFAHLAYAAHVAEANDSRRLPKRYSGVMFAFSTYEQAAEKALEFSHTVKPLKTGLSYRPFMVLGFTALYQKWLEDKPQMQQIGFAYADKHNHPTVREAIEKDQPDAISFIKKFYEQQWKAFGQMDVPVFFTVHDVAQRWHHRSVTRLMVSDAYWWGNKQAAYEDTHVSLIVHDEVSCDDLISVQPRSIIDFVEGYRANHYVSNVTETDNYRAYLNYLKNVNAPIMSNGRKMSFREVLDLIDFVPEGQVTVSDSGEYGEFANYSIYEGEEGRDWSYMRTPWCLRAAAKTVLLTAESVPAEVARWRGDMTVIELDTPRIRWGSVPTHKRRFTSDGTEELVREIQDEFEAQTGKKLEVVSNRAANLTLTRSHHSARGLNDYMGKPMASVYSLYHPHVWAYFETLNAITGRSDMVRRRHLDEINQTVGRNWGFRERKGASHTCYMNGRLLNSLRPFFHCSRYELVEQQPAIARKAQTKASKPQVPSMKALREALLMARK